MGAGPERIRLQERPGDTHVAQGHVHAEVTPEKAARCGIGAQQRLEFAQLLPGAGPVGVGFNELLQSGRVHRARSSLRERSMHSNRLIRIRLSTL